MPWTAGGRPSIRQDLLGGPSLRFLFGVTLGNSSLRPASASAIHPGILLLEPALDANYESIKQHTFPWPPK
jgi:hypothetical protein